jgi:co-chaperonin GroES (HSP10)
MISDANLPLSPVGYFMLLEERRAITKTAGGILLAPETQDAQQYLCQIGKVVAMGEQCYTHDAFNGNAWAKLGDDVLFHKHSGIRIDLKSDKHDEPIRYRLLKDNDLVAVVTDPDRIKGAVV